MKYRNRRIIAILVIALLFSLCLVACGLKEESPEKQIRNYVLEQYEYCTLEDIIIDRIFYGPFSQEGAEEILVTCKILNQPHVAGMDMTVAILLRADTMEIMSYKEFACDKVEINCMETDSGYKRILFLGTATSQGISTQYVELFAIQDNQWVEMTMDELQKMTKESSNTMGSEYFCFVSEDKLIVSYEMELNRPEDVIAILWWNPELEQFTFEKYLP